MMFSNNAFPDLLAANANFTFGIECFELNRKAKQDLAIDASMGLRMIPPTVVGMQTNYAAVLYHFGE
jgi:hypothetical protein